MDTDSKPQFDRDICIIGAGLAGASLANLLTSVVKQGWSVSLFDQADFTQERASAADLDGRATALSYGSRQILSDAGVWTELQTLACPIHHIEVSDQGRFGQAHLHASEQDSEALGYIVQNHQFGQALIRQVQQGPVECQPGQTISQVQPIDHGVRLQFDNGQSLTTRLLVMADGGRSPLLPQLGIHQQKNTYNAHAIVTQVRTSQAHGHWAYERFSQHGPIAFLPLNENDYAVVWTVSEDQLATVMAYPEEQFLAELQQRIGYRVGRLTELGQRYHYPLALITASEQIRPNIVLLGNAAHSLHPVAGQGFNLTLRDAAQLTAVLQNAQQQQQCPGRLANLQRYYEAQRQDQQITITASDWLPRLFSQSGRWLQRSRDIGLLAMAAAPTARRLFTRHAMGLGMPAAKLLTPES